jgi:hypothetical protein
MSKLLPLAELLPKCKRGILFSGPLIPPVLDGRKTVTRRMDRRWLKYPEGTLLYVCETIRYAGVVRYDPELGEIESAVYAADGAPTALDAWGWQRDVLPSIHMPRGLSRCVLRLTEAPRLEWVQDITEDEAKREGVAPFDCTDFDFECDLPHVHGFRRTWRSLHTKPGERWEDEPLVCRIAFERTA